MASAAPRRAPPRRDVRSRACRRTPPPAVRRPRWPRACGGACGRAPPRLRCLLVPRGDARSLRAALEWSCAFPSRVGLPCGSRSRRCSLVWRRAPVPSETPRGLMQRCTSSVNCISEAVGPHYGGGGGAILRRRWDHTTAEVGAYLRRRRWGPTYGGGGAEAGREGFEVVWRGREPFEARDERHARLGLQPARVAEGWVECVIRRRRHLQERGEGVMGWWGVVGCDGCGGV